MKHMGNDITIEPGSMWFRADDFNAKVKILTTGADVIRYQYLKMNGNGDLSLGRADRDQFLNIFIKWDDEYERFRLGSIWEAVQGCAQTAKGKKIKITSIFGDIVGWVFLDNFEKTEDHCTCKSTFIQIFTRIADNDNGAIYRSIEPPIGMVKVKNTKPAFSISPITVYAFTSVEYTDINPHKYSESHITEGKDFHAKYELFSLNPEKEFAVPLSEMPTPLGANEEETNMDDKIFTERLELEVEGSWWKRIDDDAIGVILEIRDDNSNNLIVRWTHPSFEGSRAGAYDRYEFIRKWVPLASYPTRKLIDPNEGESKMEDNETYLKTDKDKLEDFGTGAKREDKTGKGRYDLIPGDVMYDIEDYAWCEYYKNYSKCTIDELGVSRSAYFDDWDDIENYLDFIVNMTAYFFTDHHEKGKFSLTWEEFRNGLYNMRKALAAHYEAGAKIHGVDNWKKGLPIYGSERGGCFLDSMRRHCDQALQGKVDEPHAIAAIWNAVGAIWTLNNIDEKEEIKHNDKVDALVDSVKGIVKNWPNDFKPVDATGLSAEFNDIKYNIDKCIDVLRSGITNDKFKSLDYCVRAVYYDLYNVLVITRDLLSNFRDDEFTLKHIKNIISDIHCMINTKVGHINNCVGNITMKWETCPDNMICWVDMTHPLDIDKINILYEITGRAARKIIDANNSARETKKVDYFRGLGISRTLVEFRNKCLEKMVHKKEEIKHNDKVDALVDSTKCVVTKQINGFKSNTISVPETTISAICNTYNDIVKQLVETEIAEKNKELIGETVKWIRGYRTLHNYPEKNYRDAAIILLKHNIDECRIYVREVVESDKTKKEESNSIWAMHCSLLSIFTTIQPIIPNIIDNEDIRNAITDLILFTKDMLINLKLSPAGYYNITKGLDIKGDLNVDTTPFDGDTRYIIECLPPYARDILHQLEDINYLKDYPSVEYDIRFTLQRFIDEFKSLD